MSSSSGASRVHSATCSMRSTNVGLGPLQVIDDEDQRPAAGEGLEHLPHRPEGLLGRDRLARRLNSSAARGGRGIVVGRRLLEQPAGAERLHERPPGQPVAVGQAAAGRDGRRAVDRLQDLGHQARLADPGGAEHGEQLARAIGDRLMESVEQPPPLALAADHRRARALSPPPRVGRDRQQPEGLERRALALDRQRGDRLGVDRVTDQPERVAPEQDVAGTRRLLEPRGDIDRVAGGERARRRAAPVTASPVLTPMRTARSTPALAAQLTAQLRDLLAHLGRRADGTQRVVLVRDRDPEDRHHRVADVVLDRPAVALDHVAHAAKPALHRPPQRLGIDPLSQRRRSHDVGKDHGDDLAPLTTDRRHRHRRSARGAKPGTLGCRFATAGARLHVASLEPARTPPRRSLQRDRRQRRPSRSCIRARARSRVSRCRRARVADPDH